MRAGRGGLERQGASGCADTFPRWRQRRLQTAGLQRSRLLHPGGGAASAAGRAEGVGVTAGSILPLGVPDATQPTGDISAVSLPSSKAGWRGGWHSPQGYQVQRSFMPWQAHPGHVPSVSSWGAAFWLLRESPWTRCSTGEEGGVRLPTLGQREERPASVLILPHAEQSQALAGTE